METVHNEYVGGDERRIAHKGGTREKMRVEEKREEERRRENTLSRTREI